MHTGIVAGKKLESKMTLEITIKITFIFELTSELAIRHTTTSKIVITLRIILSVDLYPKTTLTPIKFRNSNVNNSQHL